MRFLLIPVFLGAIGFIVHQLVRHRQSIAPGMMMRLVVSVLLLLMMTWGATLKSGATTAVMLPAVVLGFMWGSTLASVAVDKASGLMVAANGDPPDYSEVEARRRRGDATGALAAIASQLQKSPDDFEGQLLTAQIQAENLRDLVAATATVEQLLTQPKHSPSQISRALNALSEWQLSLGRDREAAKATLQRLVDRFPGTAMALRTAQRVARMSNSFEADQPGSVGQLVSDCMKHLEAHPLDNHTREVLAEVYLRRYDRPDLAFIELNTLVGTPHQSREDIARWLHQAADWHLELGNTQSARVALEEIETRLPGHVLAERARERIFLLKDRLSA